MTVVSNGGSLAIRKKGTYSGFKEQPWFDKRAVTNILSLKDVTDQYRITCDSAHASSFIVHRTEKGMPDMVFDMLPCGLHVFDPTEKHHSFLTTVHERLQVLTTKQRIRAEKAKDLHNTLAYASIRDYKNKLRAHEIEECLVTLEDLENTEWVWRKEVGILKGKTVRSKPHRVASYTTKVPPEILNLHKEVCMSLDIFFVNKSIFFITLGRKINYTSITHLSNRKLDTVYKVFKSLYKFYLQRGFRIIEVYADNEFRPLQLLVSDMPRGLTFNIASANEHVPDIERRIRVVKE